MYYFTCGVESDWYLNLPGTFILISFYLTTALTLLRVRHLVIMVAQVILYGGVYFYYTLPFSDLDFLLIALAITLSTYSLWAKEHSAQYKLYKIILFLAFIMLAPNHEWSEMLNMTTYQIFEWLLFFAVILVFTLRPERSKLIFTLSLLLFISGSLVSNAREAAIHCLGLIIILSYILANIDLYHIPKRKRSSIGLWVLVALWFAMSYLTDKMGSEINQEYLLAQLHHLR